MKPPLPPVLESEIKPNKDLIANKMAQELFEQQKTDLKSLLSVIADSASVEVWIID